MASDELTTTSVDNPLERLHAKQIRFVHEYLIDRNATAAYQRAGYVASRSAGRRSAHTLLTNPDISAALKQAEAELLERVKLRQYEAHEELRAVGTSDLTHYIVAEDGNISLSPDAPKSAMKALQSVHRRSSTRKTKEGDIITTQDVRITLWNKLEAIKIAGQAEGWLTPEKADSEDLQHANNNYFLTLIQLVQKNGIKSKVGSEDFRSPPSDDDAIEIKPVTNGTTNGKNGHTHK